MGVDKHLIKAGAGDKPKKGQNITVHCTGSVVESNSLRKFWSTKDTNTPFTFQVGLGKVIRGWDEGMLDMQLGEVSNLVMSPDYGYGARGFPQWGIPPNAVLSFECEILKIQ
eukprot:TRINITY_DN8808_c0_g1_i1.p2 TRINITY_DN8808_c0_g1~~TRINITY_DN8808_c0_g1_i1.p2  ORF type:complete len:128 (-),score=48.47 TRINITY_DN8808_c0_g1_i1:65-400(-)